MSQCLLGIDRTRDKLRKPQTTKQYNRLYRRLTFFETQFLLLETELSTYNN